MPRTIDPLLLQLLDCADPDVFLIAEISAPDVSGVLRRFADQFSSVTYKVSETPATTIAGTPSGALTLASTDVALVTKFNSNAADGMDVPDLARSYRGVAWYPAADMARVLLRQFAARIKRLPQLLTPSGTHYPPIDLQLQIYRPTARAGYLTKNGVTAPAKQYSFEPLLAQPAVVRYAEVTWGVLAADEAEFAFSLRDANVMLGPLGRDPDGADVQREPYLLFVVSPINAPGNDRIEWRIDNTSGISSGVGDFKTTEWHRDDPNNPVGWALIVNAAFTNAFKFLIANFSATSQLVYAITMPAVPAAASIGRVVFERAVPEGCSAVLELSTAGSGGPWTVVKHGDLVTVKQTQYHMRVTLNASADLRRAPWVSALGIEWRIPVDVSLEATAKLLPKEIGVPFLAGSVGEGSLKVIRTGERDYHDPGTELAANYPTTKLEADLYLGSRNPLVTRANWLLMDRASITNRQPTQTSETFTLLSYAKTLKRKIPALVESINSLHTITGTPTSIALAVSPALPGTTIGGNQYDNAKYYIRVRSATNPAAVGYQQIIAGNTNTGQLDFDAGTAPLEFDLVAGDVIEVHSGRYIQAALEWIDADPADVWWEILTVHLAVPSERIGRGDLGRAGRAGLPPTVVDREPDATKRARLKVTLKLTKAEEAVRLLDQLSFIMGGCTTEIGGQIVYRQIYALYDANRVPVVKPEAPAAVLDQRDYKGLVTPTGVEQRIAVAACTYGVNTTVTDQQAKNTAKFADGNAVDWLATQDVEGLGYSEIPDDIARWCYNSNDAGLYLATQLAQRVVEACSTGIREWSWGCVEPKPWLCIGDTVVIITDQYTDFDPRRRIPVAGLWAYPLVITSVQNGGRAFRGFMLGLETAAPATGGAGTLGAQPLGAPTLDVTPTQSTTNVSYAFTSNGVVDYKVDAGAWTAAGPSPLVIARNASGGATKEVQIRATTNGITKELPFTVPPQDVTPPARSFTSIGAFVSDYSANQIEIDWTVAGFVAGDYFRVLQQRNGGGYAQIGTGITATTFTDGTILDDLDPGPSPGPNVTFDYKVEWYNSSNVLQATSTVATVISDTA
jgi:hypothetical protein